MFKLNGKAREWLPGVIAACVVGGASVGAGAATPPYRFFELTGLGGTHFDEATAINNQGVIVGGAELLTPYGATQPVRWDFGQGSTTAVQLQLINTNPKPGSYNAGYAQAVDEAGNVFGMSTYYIGDQWQVEDTVRWAAGSTQATRLPPPSWDPSDALLSKVIGSGPVGMAVGYVVTDQSWHDALPVVWTSSAAAPTELAGLTSNGDERTIAVSINSTGAVAGYSTVGSSTVALVWDSATAAPRVLPHFNSNWKESKARAINDSGLVAGTSTDGQLNLLPVLWRPGVERPSELGLLFKPPLWSPIVNVLDMNNAGAIVGNADAPPAPSGRSDPHAVIWDPLTLKVIDLNDWVDLPDGWTLRIARGINDKGQIVGTATYDPDGEGPVRERQAAFVLDPVLRLTADANNDNRVDFRDFQVLEVNFGKEGNKSQGDFDGDGMVGSGDFNLLRAEFGLWVPAVAGGNEAGGSRAIVPEPGAGMVLVGAAVWGFRRTRRKSAAT